MIDQVLRCGIAAQVGREDRARTPGGAAFFTASAPAELVC